MSKGKLRVRRAKSGDRGLFKTLWMELLKDNAELGGEIVPSDENVEVFATVFDAYVSGENKGVVLFVADDAVLMWGEALAEAPLESKYKKIAQGWGTYVKPHRRKDGVASALYEKGFNILRNEGFKYVLGSIHNDNKESLELVKKHGMEFTHQIGWFDLHKKKEDE